MYAGLDFGTSNCLIGIWQNNAPLLLPLEGQSTRLPSALYTSRQSVAVKKIDQVQLQTRIIAAKKRQASTLETAKSENRGVKILSDTELENHERGLMRREIEQRLKEQAADWSKEDGLFADSEMAFGEEAILSHIEDSQSGYFVKSPKSFLGADISNQHIELFSEIITRMMAHIKNNAEKSTQEEIQNIVIGRPVNFHGTRGELGNIQALNIIERSAIAAGFKNIDFQMEPMAAALDFERSLTEDKLVLVLDAGGGTTDCSMVKLGPSYIGLNDRTDSILGHSGDRVGGTDLDIKLALKSIMPHFGKDTLLENGLPIPVTLFWDAVTTNDVNVQAEFLSPRTQRDIASYLSQAVDKKKFQRFKILQQERLILQLNRSAELAKINLSEKDCVNIYLDYIEDDFGITVCRDDMRKAIERELDVFISLMREVETQADQKPDIIYVTGGTAKSPVIEDWIRSHYGDIEIVVGDAFGSVVSGLTTWAHRIYG
ncbi:MAG: molecular chaperone [Gammaproteobacteria bacterium]|nr:molecular chaperone [Gammaproteobacteria bacterium]